MGGSCKIDSYIGQLSRMAEANGIRLLDAFLEAGLPDSTYYRALKAKHGLRLVTAQQVADVIRKRRGDRPP